MEKSNGPHHYFCHDKSWPLTPCFYYNQGSGGDRVLPCQPQVRRRLSRRFCVRLIKDFKPCIFGPIIFLILSVLTAIPAQAEEFGRPLDAEAAIRNNLFSQDDRPVLSPDGRYAAYTLLEWPREQGAPGVYLLPNGMVTRLMGAELYLTEVETGDTLEINPGDWSNWKPAFSPDGRKIAFLSDAAGEPNIWVFDINAAEARQVSDARVFVQLWTALDRPAWSPDSSAVYALVVKGKLSSASEEDSAKDVDASGSKAEVRAAGQEVNAVGPELRTGGGNRPRDYGLRTAVEQIDVDSGNRKVLTPLSGTKQIVAYETSPSGNWVAYLSAAGGLIDEHELSVVSSGGGEPRALEGLKLIRYNGPASSHLYGAVFHWAPESEKLVFVESGEEGGDVWMVDLSEGIGAEPCLLAPELGKIVAPSYPHYDWPPLYQVAFTADGGIVVARLAEADVLSFAVIPLDGSPARRILIEEKIEFENLALRDRDTLWQPDDDSFILMGSDPATGKKYALQVSLSDGSSTMLREDRADIEFLSGVSPKRILAVFEDVKTPPDLYLFDAALRNKRRVTRINPSFDEFAGITSRYLETRAPSYDGSMRTMKTGVILPEGCGPQPRLPAVVKIYPDANLSKGVNRFGGGRMPGYELGHFWTSRGFAVVLPSLRPLTPRATEAGNIIKEMRDYLLPQIYRAAELGYIDIDRVVLMGHSFGGFGTMAVVTDTNLFRAAVGYSSAPLDLISTSLTGWAAEVARIGPGALPWTAFKQFLTNSPYQQADKVETPVLLIHGTNDSVPPQSSELMFQALQQQGKTAQLAIYPGEPHALGWWSFENAVDACQRVLDFVTRYVPAENPAPGKNKDKR